MDLNQHVHHDLRNCVIKWLEFGPVGTSLFTVPERGCSGEEGLFSEGVVQSVVEHQVPDL
eukprot:295482-Hanusia_phi.AAC.1